MGASSTCSHLSLNTSLSSLKCVSDHGYLSVSTTALSTLLYSTLCPPSHTMPSSPITANGKLLNKEALRITKHKRLHALKIKIAKVLPLYADTVPITPNLPDAAKFMIELVTFGNTASDCTKPKPYESSPCSGSYYDPRSIEWHLQNVGMKLETYMSTRLVLRSRKVYAR
jgi:hypothetical protein